MITIPLKHAFWAYNSFQENDGFFDLHPCRIDHSMKCSWPVGSTVVV